MVSRGHPAKHRSHSPIISGRFSLCLPSHATQAMVPPLPLRSLLSTKCVQPSFLVSAFESLPRRFQIRSSTICTPLRPYLTRRFYYGHIRDPKMAPQLEPFFRQCVTYSRFRESRLDADTDPENRVDDLSGSFIERTWSGFPLS